MKLLVIGAGGREHALAWKLAQSPRVQKVFVAPGIAGTAAEPGLENVALAGIPELIAFAQRESVQLTLVGPEAPLAAGIVDAFRDAGLRIFGPTRAAARLESSKDFAKEFMARRASPTARAMNRIKLKPLVKALKQMPVRARGGDARVSERLAITRKVLREIEEELWKDLLARARWRSPLLVMDEAHHLKNPATSLARQLQSPDLECDLRTGDGAMAKAFDRMLFLTATPFQLGHRELVSVLKRFGDVR